MASSGADAPWALGQSLYPPPLEKEGECRSLGLEGRGSPWSPREWEEPGGLQWPPGMEDGGSYGVSNLENRGRLPPEEDEVVILGATHRGPQEHPRESWSPEQEGRGVSWEDPRKRVRSPPTGGWLRVPLSPPRKDSLGTQEKRVPSPPVGGWLRIPLSPPREESSESPRKRVRSPPMDGWSRVPMSGPREDSWEPPRKTVRSPPMGRWLRVPLSPPRGRGWTSPDSQRPPDAPSSHTTHWTPTSSISGRDSPDNSGIPWVSLDGRDGPKMESMGRSREPPVPAWESCHDREILPPARRIETMQRDAERSSWLEEPSSSRSSSRGSSSRGDPAWETRQRHLENQSYSKESWRGRGCQRQMDSREGDACVSLQTQREVSDTLAPATALYRMAEAAMERQEGVDPLTVRVLARCRLHFAGSAHQEPTLRHCSQLLESIDPRLTPFTTGMTSLNSGGLLYAEDKEGILKGVSCSFPNLPEEPPATNSGNRQEAARPTLIASPPESAPPFQDRAALLSEQDSDQQVQPQDGASLELWHRRFGHADSATILRLQSDNLATGIKVDPGEAESTARCRTCFGVKGEMPSFSLNTVSRSTALLDLIHCELFGPFKVPSLKLQRYVLLFVDDYSRQCITFLLKETSETHRCFEIYLAGVRKRHKSDPKAFQMNSAADSVPPQTLRFLEARGISHKRGIECFPWQSRTAEKEMKSLLDMTRCMLADAYLPRPFWGHALVAATYLWNRLAVSCKKRTPFEVWIGKVPCVNHLRVFGSLVRDRREPNDPARRVFIGYTFSLRKYRVMDLETGVIDTRGCLDFNERHGVKRGRFLATDGRQRGDIEALAGTGVYVMPQPALYTTLGSGETHDGASALAGGNGDDDVDGDEPIEASRVQCAPVLSEQSSYQQVQPQDGASLELWHRHFGHADSATILRLQSDNLATGIKVFPGDGKGDEKVVADGPIDAPRPQSLPVLSEQSSDQKRQIQDETSLELWHRRFGHADSAAILRLRSDNLTTGIKVNPGEAESTARCRTCLAVKGANPSFSLNYMDSSCALMDLIHCELSGPFDVTSLARERYVLIFVDDCSRYCVTFLLKETKEMHGCFEKYLARVRERQKWDPKAFQMNSAADFISPQTITFLEDHGISHKRGVECVPGQSRTAEREIKSLLEMTRCMLADANLPGPFWGHAIMAATSLWNLLAVSSKKRTPFQAWQRKVPRVSHLHVFGSLVHDRRGPDDPAQHIFIGYTLSPRKYRVMNLETGVVCSKVHLDFVERQGVQKRGRFLVNLEKQGCDIAPFTGTGVTMTPHPELYTTLVGAETRVETNMPGDGNGGKDVEDDEPIDASKAQCGSALSEQRSGFSSLASQESVAFLFHGYDVEPFAGQSVSMTPQPELYSTLVGGETQEETHMPGEGKGNEDLEEPIEDSVPQGGPASATGHTSQPAMSCPANGPATGLDVE